MWEVEVCRRDEGGHYGWEKVGTYSCREMAHYFGMTMSARLTGVTGNYRVTWQGEEAGR